ncbi:MAG TPA: universal stress protein [Gaiellaceae bacterium]
MSAPIVLGYDGSVSAQAALAQAATLAKELDAEVVVVFGFYISPLGGGDVRDYKAALEKVGSDAADDGVKRLEAEGVKATSRLVSAKPADAIMQVADETGARLVVVGTVGEGALTGTILGSVVLKLVHRCQVPMLVVPTA